MKDDKPRFRNPDKYQVLPHREWIRDKLPHGRQGFVAEDIDLVIRRYGPLADGDVDGKFMLIEIKEHVARMDWAHRKTFGLIHRILRSGDPEKNHYVGFYVANLYDDYVVINTQHRLSMDDWREFLLGEVVFDSLFD